ncbi:MAG: UbiA family prenyltransferase [Polyangiales bacterium]
MTRELAVSWRFVRNDVWAGLVPGVAFTFAAARSGGASLGGVLRPLAVSAVYFWLYLYGHTLANQLVGVEEDRINKPDRPIPAGLVTPRGAAVRLAATVALFLAYAGAAGALRWAALWVVTFLLLNFWGHRHWFFKNSLPMGVGALAMMGGAWELARPLTPTAWRVMLTVAGFVSATSPLQDLRDVAGDLVLRRRTLPVAIGELPARVVLAVAVVAWLPVAWRFLVAPAPDGAAARGFALALAALSLHVAWRLLRRRGPAEDHTTYRRYEYLYGLYVASALAFAR